MPVHRGKDGQVVDVPTEKTVRPSGPGGSGVRTVDISGPAVPTEPRQPPDRGWPSPARGEPASPRGGAGSGGVGQGRGIPTKPMAQESAGVGPATVVHRSRSQGAMEDPPVGWLVVVEGPGMGSVATLGIGSNSIGRDAVANRVAVDHGDDMISRAGHGVIVYDERNRRFWIRHGDGTNLMYVGDEPVLDVRPLEPLTQIRMGRTVLRFVPLCGDEFSWPDAEAEER